MHSYNKTKKAAVPPLQSIRLLDQVRERIRHLHYSLQAEKVYLYWARFFIRWHGRTGKMRHSRDMGKAEVEAFLTMLANERQVSPATHRHPPAAVGHGHSHGARAAGSQRSQYDHDLHACHQGGERCNAKPIVRTARLTRYRFSSCLRMY